jgi:hypothetical protein
MSGTSLAKCLCWVCCAPPMTSMLVFVPGSRVRNASAAGVLLCQWLPAGQGMLTMQSPNRLPTALVSCSKFCANMPPCVPSRCMLPPPS